MKKTPARGGQSNLPVPKTSRGSPGSSKSVLNGRGSHSRSSEDIPRRVQLSYGNGGARSPQRRAISPGNEARLTVAGEQGQQAGVRYITEDLIRKIAREDQIEMITTLNLTLAKEGGKKIKYIENLDKLKRLTVLNLSCNMIEKIEKMDKLFKLKELNLSYNNITKIEGLESMTSLQVLNLTGNQIQHIPIWMGRKLRALRTLHIGKNNMESLSELAKLKPIPDLTHLTVAENPLSQLPHSRMYIVFHIRSLEVLDSQNITEQERQFARDRFEQDEVERLEKQLEQEETKIKKLTADKNKSVQESSFLKGTEEEMKKREKLYVEKLQEMEKELETKNDLLSKKTKELNKACEKHYQLEQELAFYKIDSKFDSLGKSPPRFHNDDDDSGQLGESPYLGRARFKANQYSREGAIVGSPGQKVTVHSLGESVSPQRAHMMEQMAHELDQELSEKQDKVSKTEERLKRLQDDMQKTETKLLQATKDLKRMGDIGDKDDVKVQVRQRLAKKMQLVNELKDSATQIEDEIQKTQETMHKNKVDVARLKGQLDALDTKDPKYRKMYAEMVDKEQQISESNQMYGQLQTQLEVMLDTIAKETDDIKKLETQLNDDRIDANDNLRQELDEIVGGLQGYLANVKNQGMKRQRDYESVLGEKALLQQKVGKLEQELAILDTEAKRYKEMEKRMGELEMSLQHHEEMNRTLEDQLHKTRHKDAEHQDRMENTQKELNELRRQLKDSEKRAQPGEVNERMVLEQQMVAEKAKTQESSKQARHLEAKDEENRRLMQQLEAAKATNSNLKDQLNDERHKLNESIPLGHLRKRLKDLSQAVKTGKTPVSPVDDRDVLGKTFKDLQLHLQDKLNKSFRDNDEMRRTAEKTELEIQALKDNLKKAENKLARKNEKEKDKDTKLLAENKANAEEVKRLNGEVNRLKVALKETQERAAQGKPVTRIVYRPESEDDRSSLNSEEKHLYDELQRELMELRRGMRAKEKENAKRLTSAENEVAELNKALEDQEQQFEDELSRLKEEAELQREAAEAKLQVIAQDLDQAQYTADYLGGVLDERDQHLQHHLKNSDMNNQMIMAQEMELSKLYEILEAQRDEIEHLNGLLDQLSMQNQGQGAPLMDDELWKLRQEVNKLKETLAMQSAYIQTMPQLATSTGTQAQFDMPPPPGFRPGVVPYHGQASGPTGRPELSRHYGPPMSVQPGGPGRLAAGTSYAPPMGSGIPVPGGYNPPHVGAEQRQVRTPPGVQPSDGRSGERTGGGLKRVSGEAAEPDVQSVKSHRSGRSGRSGRSHGSRDKHKRSASAPKTAFEPVHRPVAYNPATGTTQSRGPPAPVFYPVGSPTRGVSSGIGASAPAGFPNSGPATGHIPSGYGPGNQRPGYIGTQTHGYVGTQTPGYAGTQTPGYGSTQTPGYSGTQAGGPTIGVMLPPGVQNYKPSSDVPAQTLGYKSGRAFLPAYSTSPERPPGRIYYPSSGGIPMPPPPPPPPQYGSPGPRVTYLPVSPIATGTPQSKRNPSEGSMTIPPSPIVAGSIDMSGGQPRGILKSPTTGSDDSYLFCNVPEHHDLEDYIAELQEKVRRLKAKILKNQEDKEDEELDDEHHLIRRLRGELEERRDELEGLDLAIERQKKSLKDLRREEKILQSERASAKEDLELISKENARFKRRPKIIVDDESSDESEGLKTSRRNYLKDEINALERTLGKRRAQLKNADRLLKECNTDIMDAREQAKDTVHKYDTAASGLEYTVKEKDELERRANLAALELLKAQEQLGAIKSELHNIERKRSKQDRLLRDVNQVLSKRDVEYKDIDGKVRAATDNLRRLHDEINTATQREKDTLSALRDAEDVLGKRRSDIQRMRDQIESQKRELEKVDQLMGKKRTELHLLQDTAERKQSELASVLREADAEATAKQRDLRDLKEHLRDLETQKSDLMSHLKTKKNELNKLKEAVETEDEVLQKLISSVNKHKTELKHTYEMQRLENVELDSLKTQHAQKLAELERTQRELNEEKSELEQLNAETSRKSAEVDRLRQALERDRQEVERLTLEKQSLEDRVAAMNREKDLLDDTCKDMDNKMNMMKRNHQSLEEKIEITSRRSEKLEIELRQREKEMEEANHQRAALQKEVQQLKQACKECRSELKSLKENIRDCDDKYESLQQDLKDTYIKRDECKLEHERLNEGIRQSRLAHDDYLRQEKSKQLELQDLLKNVNNKQLEYQEAKMALNKVRKDIEREEKKLNHLVSNANIELDQIRSDLHTKQIELDDATATMNNLKKESKALQMNEEKFIEMEKIMKDLEREIQSRNEEKNELSKALSRSYEELQKFRTNSAQENEKHTHERLKFENKIQDLKNQLDAANQEKKSLTKRANSQVTELQSLAEEHFNRANRLDGELSRMRKDRKDLRKQVITENKENIHTDLRGKLTEEQDFLRYQLQQQMKRHADAMETARLQSEGTIESLREKLNTLQEVLVNTGESSDDQSNRDTRQRARSSSPGKSVLNTAMIHERNRSPSPGHSQRSYSAQRHRSRSRSVERSPSPLFPEKELLTA